MTTFKNNVKNSFTFVKADMDNIKEWIIYLDDQVQILKKEKCLNCSEDAHVGAKKSKKVHVTKCPFAKKIKPENKIDFASLDHAFDQGFNSCACISA